MAIEFLPTIQFDSHGDLLRGNQNKLPRVQWSPEDESGPPEPQKRKRRKRAGRQADPNITKRDDGWLTEFNAGLRSGAFETMADFANHVGEEYDMVRKALERARKRKKSR
jgi:hypothetical protein